MTNKDCVFFIFINLRFRGRVYGTYRFRAPILLKYKENVINPTLNNILT